MSKPLTATLLALALLLSPGALFGANGDEVTDQPGYKIWKALDAEADATAAGTAIYVGMWVTLSVWPQAGVDSGDTWEVECGVASPVTAPTVWFTAKAENYSTAAWVMEPGDACPWIRVNKPTDTNDATTVHVMAEKVR